MSAVDVVGGVYGERCAFPHWDEVYGSGGRAAAGLSSHVDAVRLHTVLPPEEKDRVKTRLGSFGVEVAAREGEQLIGFDYLHCLSDPVVTPHAPDIRSQAPLHVKADTAVLFGMMECGATVEADVCVYDPQSPRRPTGFRESGSEAKRLAIIANAHEIARLTHQSGSEAAHEVLTREKAEVVVVKTRHTRNSCRQQDRAGVDDCGVCDEEGVHDWVRRHLRRGVRPRVGNRRKSARGGGGLCLASGREVRGIHRASHAIAK